MIYCFSGTGNSKWVAERIADELGDKIEMIPTSQGSDDKCIGIVTPTYAWGVPGPVADFLKAAKFSKDQYVYLVAVCGANCGILDKQAAKLLGHPIAAAISLALPNNCIQLGDCDTKEDAKRMFAAATPKLTTFIEKIKNGEKYSDVTRGFAPVVLTKVVHPMFMKFATSDKPFSVDAGKCVSCCACESRCPVGNIKLVDGKPTWNGNCAQCTACINGCPTQAIQYGKRSAGRVRYFFSEENL